ncbi:MAG TPA: hypothetical protein VGI69_07945 [Gaiellaceae bacterium]|jgi:hypothetical protein
MRWRQSSEPAASVAEIALVPDYAEPLCAWRLWEVEDVDSVPRLRSLYRLSFWPVGAPFEARCEAQRLRLPGRPRHAAPSETCSCGIYGAPFELIRKSLAVDDGLPPWPPFVIGTVSLWGDVLECERGWRAALAYPSRLFVPLGSPGATDRAVGLRDYGVPVDVLEARTIADALDDVAELAA